MNYSVVKFLSSNTTSRGALLKGKGTQHTERSGVQHSAVEVSGFTETHMLQQVQHARWFS